jgi:hypothetical protein
MAAASASALRRRSPRSAARAASSSARALDSAALCRGHQPARAPFFGLGSSFMAASAACGASVAAALASACFCSLAACAAAFSAASRSRASCSSRRRRFSASSSSWRRISSAWRRASSSRRASSAWSISGADGASSVQARELRSQRCLPSSRLMKVRFLRTSTWMVRALPDESACLISLVDFLHQGDLLALGRSRAVAGLQVAQELLLVGFAQGVRGGCLGHACTAQLLKQRVG